MGFLDWLGNDIIECSSCGHKISNAETIATVIAKLKQDPVYCKKDWNKKADSVKNKIVAGLANSLKFKCPNCDATGKWKPL